MKTELDARLVTDVNGMPHRDHYAILVFKTFDTAARGDRDDKNERGAQYYIFMPDERQTWERNVQRLHRENASFSAFYVAAVAQLSVKIEVKITAP